MQWTCALLLLAASAHGFQPLRPVTTKPSQQKLFSTPGTPGDAEKFENPAEPLKVVFDKMYGSDGQTAPTRIVWGVFKSKIDEEELPSAEESAARREAAAASLTNIDGDERERRKLASIVFSAGTAGLAVALPLLSVPLASRMAALLFPTFLSLGFYRSYEEGL